MKEVIIKLFKNKNNKQISGVFQKKGLEQATKDILNKKKCLKVFLEDI
jgi:hypothetical protein